MKNQPPQTIEDGLLTYSSISDLILLFPKEVQLLLKDIFPSPEEIRRLMQWEKWFWHNEHFQSLIKNEHS